MDADEENLQLYPSLAAEIPAVHSTAAEKFLLNDKFHLINFAFSDQLSDEVMRSEESATHAELDAALVGHKSYLCCMLETRFYEVSEGPDEMAFAFAHWFTKMIPQWIILFMVHFPQKN